MRRYLSGLVLFALVAVLLPNISARAAGAGDVVKCPDSLAVYYLAKDGRRYLFPNEEVYFSWYTDFFDVKMVECEGLAVFPFGGLVTYQAGVKLIKLPHDPSVYAIEPGAIITEIPDEQAASDIYGEDWASRIDDVSEEELFGYEIDAPLVPGEVPTGLIVEDERGYLFRLDQDGVAVGIDQFLTTDQEQLLNESAVSAEALEERIRREFQFERMNARQLQVLVKSLLDLLMVVPVTSENESVAVIEVEEIYDPIQMERAAKALIVDVEVEVEAAKLMLRDQESMQPSNIDELRSLVTQAEIQLLVAKEASQQALYAIAYKQADEALRLAMEARGKMVEIIFSEDPIEAAEVIETEAAQSLTDEAESTDVPDAATDSPENTSAVPLEEAAEDATVPEEETPA